MNNDVQLSLERVRISWTSAEASRQCCLRSLSSASLTSPGHSQILHSCEIKSGSGLGTRLPRLCQGSKWLNGKELLTSIQKVLGSNPRWIPDFFCLWIYFSPSQHKHHDSWSPHRVLRNCPTIKKSYTCMTYPEPIAREETFSCGLYMSSIHACVVVWEKLCLWKNALLSQISSI